jgi:multicomponent Na+:H+ antiporter subunit G
MDFDPITPWLADALVLVALFVMTIGTVGIVTMPDIYTKLHAASKAVFLGVIVLAIATMMTSELDFVLRVIVICGALVLTTPVASHVIGRAAWLEREHMSTPGALDESGHHLADEETVGPAPRGGVGRGDALGTAPARTQGS